MGVGDSSVKYLGSCHSVAHLNSSTRSAWTIVAVIVASEFRTDGKHGDCVTTVEYQIYKWKNRNGVYLQKILILCVFVEW